MNVTTEILIILLLVAINALLAMSEAAVIASRRARLENRARAGDRRAVQALALARDPAPFLSTVQIGITLLGILSGAFGGATLAGQLAETLAEVSWLAEESEAVAVAIVVFCITAVSLLLGELVPKRIALASPERVACVVARPMRILQTLAHPLGIVLTAATDGILRVLRVQRGGDSLVTEEEIRTMIDLNARAGLMEPAERDLLERVFRLGDRRVSEVMVPRKEIDWLDVGDDVAALRRKVAESTRTRFPVCEGDLDHVVGVVRAKDLLETAIRRGAVDLAAITQQPLFVPETTSALRVLEEFRRHRSHVAIVVDEHGGTLGLVTVTALAEAIVVDIPGAEARSGAPAILRPDGSWLVDGLMLFADFAAQFPLVRLQKDLRRTFDTVGGFIMDGLGRVPREGDTVEIAGLRLEVVDMDGNRVDKVLVSLPRETAAG